MDYQQIQYGVRDRVAAITLNRPDKLNAWTAQMEREVNAAVRSAVADDAVRAILLTGAGRGFCAGADMSLLSEAAAARGPAEATGSETDVFGDSFRADFERKYAWLASVPKPVIAAINGPAVGLGFVIPLYCDLRVASQAARFSVIFSRRGLIAEYGMAWMLPRLVGFGNALELALTSRTIDATEAQRIGLVSRVFPKEGFGEAAHAFASELASTISPRSMAVMKKQFYQAQFERLGEAFDASVAEMLESLRCEDFREGVAHYIEKRAPSFPGR